MGRASGNGMSGVLIYTKPQDWSDMAAWERLLADANTVRLTGPRLREIEHLKDKYRESGIKSKKRYTELRQIVDDTSDKRLDRKCAPKHHKPVKKRRRLR